MSHEGPAIILTAMFILGCGSDGGGEPDAADTVDDTGATDTAGDTVADTDEDSDGYETTECGGDDCDDEDATNHPGADNDDDGYVDARCGGDDCDDFDADYNPGIAVSCTTEDHNCNGHPDNDDDGDGHVTYLCAGGDDCDDFDAAVLLGECAGVNDCCDGCWQRNGCWIDPTTGYMWEDPPEGGYMDWSSAVAYCEGLSLAGHGAGEWHLPTISELRTLIRGCPATETGGACGVTDACLDSSCDSADCNGCGYLAGPGVDGYYWDPALEDPGGGEGWYWSSSSHADDPSDAWYVAFVDAGVAGADKDLDLVVRCVRPGP